MAESESSLPRRTTVVLSSQFDWDEWFEIIKSIAIAYDVWEYIDPSKPVETTLVEPSPPKPSDINGRKTKFSSLDEDEREEYRNLRYDYERDITRYDKRRQNLASIRVRIQETVARQNLSYTFDCASVYEMLQKLEKRFNPTQESREREFSARFQRHRDRRGARTSIEKYLNEWDKIYDDCARLRIAEVQGKRAQRDFLLSVEPIEPGFSNHWRNRLLTEDVDFHQLVQHFRDYSSQNTTLASAAATFQGRRIPGKDERPCLCGEKHHFKDCPYLIPQVQERLGVDLNQQIQEQVEQKLRDHESLRDVVKRLRKKAAKETPIWDPPRVA